MPHAQADGQEACAAAERARVVGVALQRRLVLPLKRVSGRWLADYSKAPVLVPVLSLGQRMVATEGSGVCAGTFSLRTADVAAGRPALRAMSLEAKLFEAPAMQVGRKDVMEMKVAELKEELSARGEAVSGNKAWLRRRLHAAIVSNYIEAQDAEA